MSDNRVIRGRFRSSVDGFHSVSAKNETRIVHLYITKDKAKISPHDCQAFAFNNDLLICGVCRKEFLDVAQFLLHKTEHTLSKDLFNCNLCKVVVSSQELLLKHYDSDHRVPLSSKCGSKPEDENDSQLNEKAVIANGNCVETTQPEALHLTPPVLEFHRGSISKTNSGKRKSKLQVKPMLESGTVEEPSLFDKDFQKFEGTREFDEFALPGNVESNENDRDFAEVAAIAEDKLVRKENSPCRKARNGKKGSLLDFYFLLVPENSARSRFSHAGSWLQCLHCDYRTRRQSLLSSHMAKLHRGLEASAAPKMDSRITETLLQGEKVMRMSTYEATLGGCSKRNFQSKHQRFLEKPDISGTYPCAVCGKMFVCFRYLRKHLETHQTEKKFVCDDCGKSYKSRAYLRVHRRVHQKKKFSCNQCSFVSSVNAAIRAHRQIHNSGSVICDICGHAYTDRSTLGKHKRVHDLSRPFACNFPGCKWRFKTEVMCRAHIKAHTTQGKFRCAVCGYVFRHKHHLQRHELHMHRAKTTTGAHSAARAVSASRPKEYRTNDDSSHFLPIADDLDMPRDISSDLPEEFGESQLISSVPDTDELPLTFISTDLSMINVDCGLLNIEDFCPKEEEGEKHAFISELEVLN